MTLAYMGRNVKLEINLIPKSSFFTNVRSTVSENEWDRLRRTCYQKANYRCEIFNGIGPTHAVECHEIWEYDTATKIQKLVKLIALCPACHEVNHIGLAEIRGRLEPALNHLMKVNNWTKEQAIKHHKEAFILWNERNKIQWALNLENLKIDDVILPTKEKQS